MVAVLQHGCSPVPIWQSPAIFLQHSISEGVIWGFGKQASAGIPTHRQSSPSATIKWNFDTDQNATRLPNVRKGAREQCVTSGRLSGSEVLSV
jgi:hypothetical protein